MRDFKRRRGFSDRPRRSVMEEAYEDNKYYPPKKETVNSDSMTLQAKSFRELSNIRVIDVKADPNSELSYGAFPYTIIGSTSPVVDAKYPGEDNIAGNTIVMLQNDTQDSKLMNTFDVGVVVKEIQYNYVPIKPASKNVAIATEMIKSIEQAVSFGFSTMLTQLPFTTATYKTDLVIPPQYIEEGSGIDATLNKAAGYYAALIHYQAVLQSLVSPINKYIELRSVEKELMRMSFRTEAPLLTQMFGLFKKASFISEINTIGTVVINEYFDENWYKQMNTLLCVPSRKTKGMVDPLLTLIGVHAIPRLKIDATYDSDNLATSSESIIVNPDTLEYETGIVKLEELIRRVVKMMNPAYILRFLRKLNQGTLPSNTDSATYVRSVSQYAEATKSMLTYISRFAANFSTNMSNIRTFLDKLSQSDMVYWKKGVAFYVDKISQLEPHYNVLLSDVFAATYSGADEVIYDASTKRWRAWAFWNKYEGIPEFDKRSGGCFLTFGLRDISDYDTDGNVVNFNSSSGLIPVLFVPGETSSLIVTRKGLDLAINKQAIDYASLASNHLLTRLNVLGNTSLSLKQPAIAIDGVSSPSKEANLASACLLFIANVFGYGVTTKLDEDDSPVVVDAICDPDYVAFLDLEIEDVSNRMIVYCRNYAPFRVDTPDGARTVGFGA